MKTKNKVIGLGILTLLLVLALSLYNYLYQEPRNIAKEEVAHQLDTQRLNDALRANHPSVTYVDKVIMTYGEITAVDLNTVVIDNSVQVSFQENMKDLTHGNTITIKGRCVGYDDLLEVVKIDQAVLIKN